MKKKLILTFTLVLFASLVLAFAAPAWKNKVMIKDSKFWKNEFGVALGLEKGKVQYNSTELEYLLTNLQTYYPEWGLNEAYAILSVSQGLDEEIALKECFATMLNYANGAIQLTDRVKTRKGSKATITFGSAMTDFFHGRDYIHNADMCRQINKMRYIS